MKKDTNDNEAFDYKTFMNWEKDIKSDAKEKFWSKWGSIKLTKQDIKTFDENDWKDHAISLKKKLQAWAWNGEVPSTQTEKDKKRKFSDFQIIQFGERKFDLCTLLWESEDSSIFKAFDSLNQEYVCLKIEFSTSSQSVEHEYNMLNLLEGCKGIPRAVIFGSPSYELGNVLVTDTIGETLAQIVRTNDAFHVEEVWNMTLQLIRTLQEIHNRGVIHRDISPFNIIKDCQSNSLYLIDFGFACLNTEISDWREKSCGTFLFMSLSTQSGNRHEFKDDMESLFYVIVFVLNGYIPWYVARLDEPLAATRIAFVKNNFSKNFKKQIAQFINYDVNYGDFLQLQIPE